MNYQQEINFMKEKILKYIVDKWIMPNDQIVTDVLTRAGVFQMRHNYEVELSKLIQQVQNLNEQLTKSTEETCECTCTCAEKTPKKKHYTKRKKQNEVLQ